MVEKKINGCFVTTTGSIPGYQVKSCLDALIVPCIGAASQLKDTMAMFTDFMGGRSGSYQKAYKRILELGIIDLTREARTRGANAVVGLHIDVTNLSEGKSLLMFLLYGTAVVVEPNS